MSGKSTRKQPVNTGLVRHILEVVAPPIDMHRLQTVLAGAFSATSVKLRTTVVLREAKPARTRHLSAFGARVMGLLADGKPWRSKHLIDRGAQGLQPSAVRKEMERLLAEGRVVRPRHGV